MAYRMLSPIMPADGLPTLSKASPRSIHDAQTCAEAGIDLAVQEELIAWLVKLNSGMASAEETQGFLNWRAQHPSHEAAWQRLHAVEQTLAELPSQSKRIAANTLALASSTRQIRGKRGSTFKLLGIATITIVTSALFANQYAPGQQVAHYSTRVGQRDSVTLVDGTRLMLNTNSTVDVKLSLFKREIVLQGGEIYIATGQDSHSIIGRRPFWVNTGQAKLEAIGTRFAVNQRATSTRLHVAQGSVAMHVGQYAPVLAYADDTYTMPDAMSPIKNSAASHGMSMDPMAWVEGVLVAKQMRLDEFVAELSRYQDLPLVCEVNVGDLSVSGVFQLNGADPVEHALKAISRTLPVRIVRQDNAIVIRKQ